MSTTPAALEQVDRGRLAVRLLADDIPADPKIQTDTELRLPSGSTREGMLPTLDDLKAAYHDEADLA